MIDDLEIVGCPIRNMTEPVWDTIVAWRHVAMHGTYPKAGGTDDQTAWFLRSVDLLDGERSAYERREIERGKRA